MKTPKIVKEALLGVFSKTPLGGGFNRMVTKIPKATTASPKSGLKRMSTTVVGKDGKSGLFGHFRNYMKKINPPNPFQGNI